MLRRVSLGCTPPLILTAPTPSGPRRGWDPLLRPHLPGLRLQLEAASAPGAIGAVVNPGTSGGCACPSPRPGPHHSALRQAALSLSPPTWGLPWGAHTHLGLSVLPAQPRGTRGAQRTIAGLAWLSLLVGGGGWTLCPTRGDLHSLPRWRGHHPGALPLLCPHLPLNAGKTFPLKKRVRHEIDWRLFGETHDFAPSTWSHLKKEQNGSSGQEGGRRKARGALPLGSQDSSGRALHPWSLAGAGWDPGGAGLVWLLAITKHRWTSRTPCPSWRPGLSGSHRRCAGVEPEPDAQSQV